MGPVEVIIVKGKNVTCDGANHKPVDTSSHPLVYLNMGEKDFVICPYCSKYFTTSKQNQEFEFGYIGTNSG